MARGQKTCEKCGTKTGPRAYTCKNCGASFNIQKGVTKRREKSNGERITDWHSLESGDYIKVVAGSGPYFQRKDGERDCMGYNGIFKVSRLVAKGIVCYPIKSNDSGFCFIYMGDKYVCEKSSINMRKHKINKIDPQFVMDRKYMI